MFAADNGGTAAWVLRNGRLQQVWRNGNGGTSPVVAGGLLLPNKPRHKGTVTAPYAGGFTTDHYGLPGRGRHALQIEISRALYMDQRTLRRGARMDWLASRMAELVAALGRIDGRALRAAASAKP